MSSSPLLSSPPLSSSSNHPPHRPFNPHFISQTTHTLSFPNASDPPPQVLTPTRRQNPTVLSQAAKIFVFIAQALEAETLQGATATRLVAAAKQLVATAGIDANQVLSTLTPETQQTVRSYFG